MNSNSNVASSASIVQEIPPRPVEITPLSYGEGVRSVELIGQVEARTSATLRSQTSGVVQQILVEPGDAVSAGTTVAILDDADQRLALSQAQARLASERSLLASELQPGGDRPEITITTPYPGASPTEVEDLVTRPIEERMEEVEGIQEINSTSRLGISTISLEFDWGTDVDERFVDVLGKLQQVASLPLEADESDVEIVSSSSDPMMWAILTPKLGFTTDEYHYRDLVDDVVMPRLRQVERVGQFLVSGGREREVEVVVDP
ncbi:MAG: efflux RND transporter permease subunit, partial [Cyanobacteria bacterium P01_D01_bin.44]